jgi:4-amino-4-deoxy-L-arabinose transferase-like glycosyltransferase
VSAQYLADGRGFVNSMNFEPYAGHPPMWTLLATLPQLVSSDATLLTQLMSCVLGSITVFTIGIVGRRIGNDRVGWGAALVATLYPGLWIYEREVLAEPLLFLLTAIMIFLAYRFIDRPSTLGAVLLGVVGAALILTRPDQVLSVFLVVVPALVVAGSVPLARRLAWLGAVGAAVVVLIAPWSIYASDLVGETVIIVQASDGNVVARFNCDETYHGEHLGYFDWACLLQAERGGPSVGAEYIADHLDRVPIVEYARHGRAFGFFRPTQQMELDHELYSTPLWVQQWRWVLFWPLAVAAIVGGVTLRRRRMPIFPLMAFVISTIVAITISYGETRYRAGLEVPLVLLAGVGIDVVLRRVGRPGTSGTNTSTTMLGGR